MDLEDNINLENNNNNQIKEENKDNKEEENYHKEYKNIKAKGEIYAINFHQNSGTLIIRDREGTTYFLI